MTPETTSGAGWLLGAIAAIWIAWLAIVVAFVLCARRVTATPWRSAADVSRDDPAAADGLLVQRLAGGISEHELLAALSRRRGAVAGSTDLPAMPRQGARPNGDAVGIFPRLEVQLDPGGSPAARGHDHV